MERLNRSAVTNPAWDKIERCDDKVLCGTAKELAISPAGNPFGSCFTNNLNASNRVDWAKAARARIVCSFFICPEIPTYIEIIKKFIAYYYQTSILSYYCAHKFVWFLSDLAHWGCFSRCLTNIR
jgi:hypothetical protein